MTRDIPDKMSNGHRKRSCPDDVDSSSPSKRQPVSDRLNALDTSPASYEMSSGMSDGPRQRPMRSSPDLPSYNNLAIRSSVGLEDDQNEQKPDTREHTVDPGLAVLGEPVTKLVELVTTLRDNGIARLDIDLPQIVVVGDQSTGKSSLIEGLSAIKVPRKEGTCTRCPLEINLKPNNGSWQCRISIVKQYQYKASNADPSLGLGPWNHKLSQAVVEHFVDVANKSEIPYYIGQAQLAVLNPSKPVKAFALPPSQTLEHGTSQEPFSPNVIRLDIVAPKLPSLSFFDLPGIIVQDVEPYVPKMIRNLAKSYISSSRALVLLTVPMDNDRANSSSAGLVFETGAQDRTIGIISKPDRLVEANIEQWRDILDQKKFQLHLGYRVVMNPSDPTIEHVEARRQERNFFMNDPIFSGPLGRFQDRFGTENLQASLSIELLAMIRDCLPEIEGKVNKRVSEINKELVHLPKAPEGPVVLEIQSKLINLQHRLAGIIDNTTNFNLGDSGLDQKLGDRFFQDWHTTAQMLFEKLILSEPKLDLSGLSRADSEPIILDSSDDEPTKACATPQKAAFNDENAKMNSTRQKTPNEMILVSGSGVPSGFSPKQRNEIELSAKIHAKKFSLDQLRAHLHAYNGGVYGVGDPRVFERLFAESTKHWWEILKPFLVVSIANCKKLLVTLIKSTFPDLKGTELLRDIMDATSEFVGSLERKQVAVSKRLLGWELGKPLNLDSSGQESKKLLIAEQLQELLCKTLTEARLAEMRAANNRVNATEEKKLLDSMKAKAKLHHQELNELAGIVSYYKVVAERFSNYNALSMRNEFFYELKTTLSKSIGEAISLSNGDEALRKRMVPSQGAYQRRKDLERELELLKQAKHDVIQVLAIDGSQGICGLYEDDGMDY